MILIISQSNDQHAALVSKRIEERRVKISWFDPAEYPRHTKISLRFDKAAISGNIIKKTETIHLDQVRVGWIRRPGIASIQDNCGDSHMRQFIEDESRNFIHNLWECLPCKWIPGAFPKVAQAERKLAQLRLAHSLGFDLPDTLVSNDPEAFINFYQSHSGAIVSKLLGFGLDLHFSEYSRYTQWVTARDLMHYRSLKLSPVIFQSYVPKRVEIRATVVGEKVFAAEIHSQATNRTRHDWRRYNLSKTPHFPHLLPLDVEKRCVSLVKKMDLCFGAIDLVLTPDGQYIFLEINPSGQWLWIEELTGLPISDAVCDLLIELDRTGDSLNTNINLNKVAL